MKSLLWSAKTEDNGFMLPKATGPRIKIQQAESFSVRHGNGPGELLKQRRGAGGGLCIDVVERPFTLQIGRVDQFPVPQPGVGPHQMRVGVFLVRGFLKDSKTMNAYRDKNVISPPQRGVQALQSSNG